MKIEMEFQGLQELVKAFEDAASDEDIRAVNKKIVEQGEPVVKRIMSLGQTRFISVGRMI